MRPIRRRIGAVTGGNGSAFVRFTAPANNGSPISSYGTCVRIEQRRNDREQHRQRLADHRTGLTNGKSYTCTVTATNAVGTSAPSAASQAFVTGKPGPPTNVRVGTRLGSGRDRTLEGVVHARSRG